MLLHFYNTWVIVILFSLYTSAAWELLPCPDGQRIKCFSETDSTLYVGTEGGLYYSFDGESWNIVKAEFDTTEITAFIEHESDLYISTIVGYYKSADNGKSWTKLSLSGLPYYRAVSFASKDGVLYAAMLQGVYYSEDKGNSWHVAEGKIYEIYSFIAYNGKLWAGTVNNFYSSGDNGKTWQEVLPDNEFYMVKALAAYDSTIIVGSGKGIYVSNDRGITWDTTTFGELYSQEIILNDKYMANVKGNYVYLSDDKGATWQELNNGLPLNPRKLIFFQNKLFAGTDEGIYCIPLSDTGTWKFSQGTIPFGKKMGKLFRQGNRLFCCTELGLLIKYENNYGWRLLNREINTPPTGKSFKGIDSNDDYIYVYSSEEILRSNDLGKTWDTLLTTTFNIPIKECFISDTLILCKLMDYTLSPDKGKTWTNLALPNTTAIQKARIYDDKVFVTTESDGSFRSDDFGVSWKKLGTFDLTNDDEPFITLAGYDSMIFAHAGTSPKKLYQSFDYGDSWEISPIGDSLSGTFECRAGNYPVLLQKSVINAKLYSKKSNTWHNLGNELPAESNQFIEILNDDVYFFTENGLQNIPELYRRPLDQLVQIKSLLSTQKPSNLLSVTSDKNYLHFHFNKKNKHNYRISIYSIAGRQLLRKIISGKATSFKLLKSSFTSGIYPCTIESQDNPVTPPFIITITH